MLHTGQNITHKSQWKTTEDFDISDLIHFLQLTIVFFFYKLYSEARPLLPVDLTSQHSL